MFTKQELNKIDRDYFRVISIENDVVVLESKNTRHGWFLYRPLGRQLQTPRCILFHRHDDIKLYHKQCIITFNAALRYIKKHDRYQIDYRWGGKSYLTGKTC